MKWSYDINDTNRILVAFDGYNDTHGEPGGLTLTPGPDAVLYEVDRNATSRFFDQFELKRYIGWGIFESDLTNDTLLRASMWGGRYTRSSYRQNGGGFGTLPDPTDPASETNQIELARFNTFGFDTRVRHDWSFWDEIHTLTGGIEFYYDDAPRTDKLGTAPNARTGQTRNESFRETVYGSLFAENRFVWGDFQFIPALRLENYSESVIETVNVDKQRRGEPLADESDYHFQPLFGFGGVYTVAPTIETYANISSAYRPPLYTQAVPTTPNLIVAGNLSSSVSYQYELGFRGYPMPWVYWDTSLFYLDFEDQIGTVQLSPRISEVRNIGSARHYGWEFATEVGSLGLYDYLRDTRLATQYGDLSLFGSLMLLSAEFTSKNPPECDERPELSSCLHGKTPAYAPDYLARVGVEYVFPEIVKASLLTTVVANQYANDNNTPDFFIPHYTVSDLTIEANVWGETLALYAGVNNIFDEDYYARIRPDGIQPAYARNYYGGFKVYF
jgi:Fe(3+) dicitrate transport protein